MIRIPATAAKATMGTTTASAVTIAETRVRRISRMIPQYSSAGICPVFQRRWHVRHSHRSPYGTYPIPPQSQRTVIWAPRTFAL